MTSLPVLHLKATSSQNMTVTDDPYETTATLYTFLRSTPSVAEREMALQPFLDALHAAPSGRGALTREPNHRLVQLLEAVAVDGVFRRTPQTLPALARHSDEWVRRLGYDGISSRIKDDELHLSKGSRSHHEDSKDEQKASSPSPSPESQVVRASDIHQFYNPYTSYEAQYIRYMGRTSDLVRENELKDGHTVRETRQTGSPRREEMEEHMQYSASTQAPEEVAVEHAEQQSQQLQHRSYLSAEVSALTAAESDVYDQHGEQPNSDCNSNNIGKRDCDPRTSDNAFEEQVFGRTSPPAGIHPVLELITRQVEQAVAAHSSPKPMSSSPSLDSLIKDKMLRLTSRLDAAAEEVSAAMYEKEELEEVWSPYYSRLKTSIAFVEALQQRLGSAVSLYQLQRYERETLQQARVGVQMEALSLKLILRDVRARLAEAEEVTGESGTPRTDQDVEFMEQLREVLSPSVDSTAKSREEDA